MHPANKWLISSVSAALVAGVTAWEGTKYYAYKDIVGVPTVCQGYTGPGIVFGRKYTAEECSAFLAKDLKTFSDGVLKCVNAPLNANQYNAFVIFSYNIGTSGFCSSRALKLFNEGKTKEGCTAIAYGPDGKPVWSYAGGKFVQGLFNRRKYESALCLGDPSAGNN